jgi:hypothetical protein
VVRDIEDDIRPQQIHCFLGSFASGTYSIGLLRLDGTNFFQGVKIMESGFSVRAAAVYACLKMEKVVE